MLLLSYMYFPEFRRLSLEEIDLIMETEEVSPVKMSLRLQKAKEEKRQQEQAQATGNA